MALPVTTTRIVTVGKPLVGQSCPSEVRADVQVSLPKRQDLRREWEQLRKNDVLFLLTVVATAPVGTKFDVRRPFKEQFKVTAARGCEVVGLLSMKNELIDEMGMLILVLSVFSSISRLDPTNAMREFTGDSRTFRVRLDPNQYEQDVNKVCYLTFSEETVFT